MAKSEAREQKKELIPQVNKKSSTDTLTLEALIIGVLYAAGQVGRDISELRKAIGLETAQLEQMLTQIIKRLDEDPNSGLMIRQYGSKYKLLTKIEVKKALGKLIRIKNNNPLPKKVLEVLAIVAYNQPCTRQTINSIRHGDSTQAIDKLISLGFINEIGRQDAAGRPFIYEVTQEFYDLLGINDISDLPEIGSFNLQSYKNNDLFNEDYDDE